MQHNDYCISTPNLTSKCFTPHNCPSFFSPNWVKLIGNAGQQWNISLRRIRTITEHRLVQMRRRLWSMDKLVNHQSEWLTLKRQLLSLSQLPLASSTLSWYTSLSSATPMQLPSSRNSWQFKYTILYKLCGAWTPLKLQLHSTTTLLWLQVHSVEGLHASQPQVTIS